MTKPPDRPGPYPEAGPASGAQRVLGMAIQAVDLVVPGLGLAGNVALQQFVFEPTVKRRDAWFKKLGETLEDLLDRGVLTLDDLDQNEAFVNVVTEATTSALRTHLDEKRELLVNAAVNTALGSTLDDVVRGSFMDYIERFSPLHIRVLRILARPESEVAFVRAANGSFGGSQKVLLMEALCRDNRLGADDTVDRVLADLSSSGLIEGMIGGMMSANGLLAKRTSRVGDAFLDFVSKPVERTR